MLLESQLHIDRDGENPKSQAEREYNRKTLGPPVFALRLLGGISEERAHAEAINCPVDTTAFYLGDGPVCGSHMATQAFLAGNKKGPDNTGLHVPPKILPSARPLEAQVLDGARHDKCFALLGAAFAFRTSASASSWQSTETRDSTPPSPPWFSFASASAGVRSPATHDNTRQSSPLCEEVAPIPITQESWLRAQVWIWHTIHDARLTGMRISFERRCNTASESPSLPNTRSAPRAAKFWTASWTTLWSAFAQVTGTADTTRRPTSSTKPLRKEDGLLQRASLDRPADVWIPKKPGTSRSPLVSAWRPGTWGQGRRLPPGGLGPKPDDDHDTT